MLTFFISLSRLLTAIWQGIKTDIQFRVLVHLLATLLIGATVFYWRMEGWSIIDSLYFSVMTMSTIGYGDFVPSSDGAKLFTIIFAMLSIGVFVAVVTKLVKIIIEQKIHTADKLKNFATSHGLGTRIKNKKAGAKKTDQDPDES